MTRPSPVTDEGLVERVRLAIVECKGSRFAPLTGDEELEARAALAASDRDVLVKRIGELEEAATKLVNGAHYLPAFISDSTSVRRRDFEALRAALTPLAGGVG